jgi:hypothetical protein
MGTIFFFSAVRFIAFVTFVFVLAYGFHEIAISPIRVRWLEPGLVHYL